jgi:hypothetical protein
MNYKQALKLAIECITGEHPSMRQYVVGANAYKMGIHTPANERDYKAYQELAEAMQEIEADQSQGRLF